MTVCFLDAQPKLNRPLSLFLKFRQFAQRWDSLDAGNAAEPVRIGRQQDPRSEDRQLLEGVPALTGEGACPPRRLAVGAGFKSRDHVLGGRSQNVQTLPRRFERGRTGIGCGRKLLLKLSEL